MKQFLDRELGENEYLLKIYPATGNSKAKGFLTQLNQDKSIPVNFLKWHSDIPYEIVTEDFRSRWSIDSARFGESQIWIVMIHPDGYTVEVRLGKFIELLKKNHLINGVLRGVFKYNKGNLIGKE